MFLGIPPFSLLPPQSHHLIGRGQEVRGAGGGGGVGPPGPPDPRLCPPSAAIFAAIVSYMRFLGVRTRTGDAKKAKSNFFRKKVRPPPLI